MADTKQELLNDLARGLKSGAVSRQEVLSVVGDVTKDVLPDQSADNAANIPPLQTVEDHEDKISAADILNTIGALIVYAAICVFLSQAWDSFGTIVRILLTFGLGVLLWFVASRLINGQDASEQSKGIGSAILLVGSLSISAGVGVAISEFISIDENSLGLILFGATIVSSMHLGMDMIVKRTVTAVFAVLYAVVAYLGLTLWLFYSLIYLADFWGLVVASTGLLMLGGGMIIYKQDNSRHLARSILWALGGFVVLGSLLTLSFISELKVLWQLAFPLALYGAFMASIKTRSKNFLYSGALFLFIYVIYMSFYYFGSGIGAAGALMFGGFGIIGTGALVQNLKKKYFASGSEVIAETK